MNSSENEPSTRSQPESAPQPDPQEPGEDHGKRSFTIKIDRITYEVHERELTGLQLRHKPTPPIGPDRDLFEVVPGGSDKKILDTEVVNMRDGLRFFTAPAQINPGSDG